MKFSISTPKGAARLLLIVVLCLLTLKIIAGLVTSSISIWAQAADSSSDVIAVIITYFTIGFAMKPADEEHQFGHGKIEGIAAFIQSILLLGASASIGYSAIQRILHGEKLNFTESGIAIMLVSMITSIILSRHLYKVAKSTNSVVLEANATNIRGDVYSTAGVLVGLILVRITGLTIIDPIIALAVVVWILRATYRVARMAFTDLIDVRIPKEEVDKIVALVKEHSSQFSSFHGIRTRKSGGKRFVNIHLLFPKNVSVVQAHGMCNHLEKDINVQFPNTSIYIHVEPCNEKCNQCSISSCDMRVYLASLSNNNT